MDIVKSYYYKTYENIILTFMEIQSMGINLDKIKPSDPLSYRFGLALDYFIDRFDNQISRVFIDRFDDPKNRLFIDAVEYIKQKELVLKDALDVLQVFADFLRSKDVSGWKASYLYNPDWAKMKLIELISVDPNRLRSSNPDRLNEDAKQDVYDRAYNPKLGLCIGEVNYINLVSCNVLKNLSPKYNKILDILELLKQEDTYEIKSIIAAIYTSADQFDKAIEIYESIEQKNPYDYYNLGTIYLLEKNDPSKAIKYYSKAAELPEAIYNLGISYIRNGEWGEAFLQFGRLAKPCSISGKDYNIDNGEKDDDKREKLSNLVSSEKPYIGGLTYDYDYDFLLRDISLDGEETPTNETDLDFHDKKSSGSESQLLRLDSIITQMSCNNLGVCCYYRNNNTPNVIKALEWFETALSWEEATGLEIGRDNIRRLVLVETSISTEELRQQEEKFETVDDMTGNSNKMKRVYRLINKLADVEANVLITGENGTGKEKAANAIHKLSERKDKSFIPVNCGAFSETILESELFGHEKGAFTGATKTKKGVFELADGGTIFLDEIGEASRQTQVKLLRVIQERKFMRLGGESLITTNIRIISASNKKLKDEVEKGNFREDLYYRVNVCRVQMPPLRERKEDIPLLISQFLKQATRKNEKKVFGISERVVSLLNDCNWPGNVRQLENAIEALVVNAKGRSIQLSDFTDELRSEVLNELGNMGDKESILTREEYIEILEKSGLTEEAFANSLNLSRVLISNMKSGIRNISIKTSKKIIEKYGHLISM
jgi:DNA-binding NtrC family response regulator/tetratricopeptide (TPR) repeat protein